MAADMEKIEEIGRKVAESCGVEMVEAELRGGGKARMLRFFIDKPEGVTHEDCANFSRDVGTILDVEEAVPGGQYLLEVSSPGLDRKLSRPADFERFQGSLAKVMTYQPVNGNRHFEGRIQKFENGRVTLELSPTKKKPKKGQPEPPSGTLELELSNIEKANLVPEI